VNLRNTVVVMTSNLGSQFIQEMAGEENYAVMKKAVMETVAHSFRPEFINRIDEVVVFHSLEQEQIRAIAELQIEQLKRRLRDQNIDLRVSRQALDKLTQAGFDPVYGARPLKRSIQTHLETPLARELLAGRFGPGDTVSVEVHGEELVFHT
jgi:ATP-dependent Clp protease ATP-binding subunit ClpB